MDLHGIDLNLLVAFDALMAERNVTRAGVRIGRTQPAMSAALARLRLLLRDELFVRGAGGLQPTPRALELSGPLGEALASIQQTLDFTQSFDPARSSACFSVGLSEHPAFTVLPPLLHDLAAQAPGVTLRIRGFTAREDALALLDGGEADIVVGVPAGGGTPRIPTLPLFEERFVCVVRQGHPLASMPMSLDAFLSFRHLLVSPEGDGVGLADLQLAKLGRQRTIAISLPQMYAAPALLAESDLVSVFMAGAVRASGMAERLVALPLPFELAPVPFVLHWHRRNDAHPAQRWLRGRVAEVSARCCQASSRPSLE